MALCIDMAFCRGHPFIKIPELIPFPACCIATNMGIQVSNVSVCVCAVSVWNPLLVGSRVIELDHKIYFGYFEEPPY